MKRATYTATRSAEMSGNFNPRPHEEGDSLAPLDYYIKEDFNPRPHEEGDSDAIINIDLMIIFQSTPS